MILPKTNQTGPNEWADVEDNDKAIQAVVNGEIEDDNIAAGAAIAGSKLANDVLKLLVTGTERKVAFGTTSLTLFTEAGHVVGAQVVEHGLGKEPAIVIPTTNSLFVTAGIPSKSKTQFEVRVCDVTAGLSGAKVNIDWIAIG